jgi:hypothetical protein
LRSSCPGGQGGPCQHGFLEVCEIPRNLALFFQVGRAVARGNSIVGAALEDVEVFGCLGHHRHCLDAGRAGTDDRHASAFEPNLPVRPAVGLQPFAPELIQAGKGNRLGLGEVAGAHDEEPAGNLVAAVSLEVPALVFVRPLRLSKPRAETEQAPDIQLVGHPVQVLHQFRLSRVAFLPLPSVIYLPGKKIAVEIDTVGIDTRPGVAVVIPGATDAGGTFDTDHGQAFLAEAVGGVDAAETGSDNRYVENLFVHMTDCRS